MNVSIGTNDFFGVPFPLVLADRFFHIYTTPTGFKLDIFRWDEQRKQPVYEVKASKPLADNISTNPTGIITFSEFSLQIPPQTRSIANIRQSASGQGVCSKN